ncbi:MAG TPA: type IV pilus assembly protein PilM [Candidatus Paceibacterota bacterium]|nr:type IV pilus assembly protein PilM [Candidatus Paceibacterota bacterium]
MQNPFNHLFSSGSYLAVDIGTTSIKAIEVRGGGKVPRVANYGILESSGYLARANQALQTSGLKIFEADVVEFLKALVRQMGTPSRAALASLPPFTVFTTILDFPPMDRKEIAKAMVYQARQYVPLPLEEVALDWFQIGAYQDEKGFTHQKIMLISVPQEQIQKYQRIFKAAGLDLKALEIESLSIARLFADDPTPTLVVDIGSRSTNIIFLENGQLTFSGQSDFGGASLTQAIATGLGINPLRAEELKKEKGILEGGANYELSTIMLPFLDAILNEVKKVQFVYQEQVPMARRSERVVLAGGGANLLGIESYFEREFGVPVVKAAPFLKFASPPEIAPFLPELNPVMAVGLGLGMKQFM